MKLIWVSLLLLLSPGIMKAQSFTPEQYRQDFNYFLTNIQDEYCYFNKKQTDWEKVKQLYAPLIDTVSSRNAFVTILEKALYELYDHHCNLNTNTPYSKRLVPTSADIWAEYINGKPVITEVRMHSGAEKCGIMAGMEVVALDNIPVQQAVQSQLPKTLRNPDTEASAFALRLLLAGDHVKPRSLRLRQNGAVADYYPDKEGVKTEQVHYSGMIESKMYNNTGYLRINNCLYDNALIPQFDSVMLSMKNTASLVLDLRETPSGGNTAVARAILGWFIHKDHFYQKHEYYAEEKQTGIKRSWMEIVSPRPGKYYSRPLVILVNHWTGSIAEGITVGFDCFKRPNTKIIGTTMARLNGAVYSYELPNTKIGFSYTAERLYHINGKPREEYVPAILPGMNKMKPGSEGDVFIKAALNYLKGK
ncbi:MAG: S41 family peptidase [Ferruginibacter sp.]